MNGSFSSFYDQAVLAEADANNAPADPPAIGYRADEAWIRLLTPAEWELVHQIADARDALFHAQEAQCQQL